MKRPTEAEKAILAQITRIDSDIATLQSARQRLCNAYEDIRNTREMRIEASKQVMKEFGK